MFWVKVAGFFAGVISTCAVYHQTIYVRVVDIHEVQSKRLVKVTDELMQASHEVAQLAHSKMKSGRSFGVESA